ncbi:histidine phosphatase family protein [Leifsonia sp. F6_8S_P_1B]|jgi:probable phosphoglycerate mutase|uniref:Histidine phosphatase family protein n=1 Tax=Leifsonia williamsii TaxID=3035919 RepID=A0ABT8K7L8_9MICO|nr:histidine phosphatase family protein [Leifsonia williamsii]MDN4613152.1 histidine phosphatase family protein [Leifsonia williamsii]
MNDGPHPLLLVRHGQTALNAEGRLRGLANPPLDETGIAEARAVADALASRGVVEVRSSPLDRAVTTARIIAERCGCAVETDSAFNDRDYGHWTGQVKQEVVAEFGSIDAAPGVEPLSRVLERAMRALDRLAGASDGAVCVVTHDAVIRPLLEAIDPASRTARVRTGSWSELLLEHGVWSVVQLDQEPIPGTA